MTALIPARCLAIILHDDPDGRRAHELQYEKYWQPLRPSTRSCSHACQAYEEGARNAWRRLLGPSIGWYEASNAADRNAPTYTELRNFLVGELEADYRVACVVAFAHVTRNNRLYAYKKLLTDIGERGWL